MGDKKVYQLLFFLVILIISAKVRSQTDEESELQLDQDNTYAGGGDDVDIIMDDDAGVCSKGVCSYKDSDCGLQCYCDYLHPPNGVCLEFKFPANPDPDNKCSRPDCSHNDLDCGNDCICIIHKDKSKGVCWDYNARTEFLINNAA